MPVLKNKIKNIELIIPGVHAVLFYEKEEEIIDTAPAFILNSLKWGQKVIYVDEKENQIKIEKILKKAGVEVDKYCKNKQLLFLNKEKIYGSAADFNADKMIRLLEENLIKAEAEGFKGLSISGELKGIIDFDGGKEEIIKYEWKLHDNIFEKYPISALCRYELNSFDCQTIKAAVELHDYIIWQNELHENPYYIDPEGYRQKKIEEYEIKNWLRNIQEYQKKENYYKKEIESKNEELSAFNSQLTAYNQETVAINEELEISFRELEKLNTRFEEMLNLFSNMENINTMTEDQFLAKILKKALEIIPEADYGCCYTFGEKYVNFIDCIGHNLKELEKVDILNEAFLNKNEKIEILKRKEIKKKNRAHMSKADFEKMEVENLDKVKEIMYFDLKVNGEIKAGLSLDIELKSSKNFSQNSKKIFSVFYNLVSSFYQLREYNILQDNFTKELISSTVKMLEMYDLYTRGHSENVAKLAVKIAEEMNLAQKRIDAVYWAGLVHDIGKMLIPLSILNKEGSLSSSEYEVVKEHPVLGANVLGSSKTLKHISHYVRHHHENWDGSGYPAGLRGNEIPLEAQILSAADAWDAMRSSRTYRQPLAFKEALKELKDNKGSQFSPVVVEALLRILTKKEE